ncbi:hypothetical protein DNTS_005369 [Danionella cerebrum]|uniref:Somatostatin/Cortistatin C-terminal domain-containing protein n=1 Tax=Danionella cerebrum TaxID=2873325 RepID=A0A553NM23_9TELE|nr:hypothetical protein DNTS_005369 [Danionella translucida]
MIQLGAAHLNTVNLCRAPGHEVCVSGYCENVPKLKDQGFELQKLSWGVCMHIQRGARRFDGSLKESHKDFQIPVSALFHVISVSMQLLASLVSLLLMLYSVRAAAVLPVEERNLGQSRELNKERKELILKLISGLLDGVDNSVLAGDLAQAPLDLEEPLESRLEERAVYNRVSQLPQRDRKAPCKNFFWKTFTSC